MYNRRNFLSKLGVISASLGLSKLHCTDKNPAIDDFATVPTVISTWNNHKANQKAWSFIKEGKSSLDAVESGIKIVEADPDDTSVGYGGFPDRNGIVTLDACIMDALGNAGSVSFLKNYMHPISIARKVMENTDHVMLSGQGAADFAASQGFESIDLLTETSIKAYKKWLVESKYQPKINAERHDTIGMLAIDHDGNLSGGCSTSGLAFKMHGRVGDSPIIGAGLYVDNEVGAAAATGLGELVLKTLGSFLVVEYMRAGMEPSLAAEKVVQRINSKYDCSEAQVGFVALNKKGSFGGYSIQPGFQYVLNNNDTTRLIEAPSIRS